MKIVTKSSQETQSWGKKIAEKLWGGEILALEGNLGSGKTTFVQGLAKGLGIKGRVVSPTFIIMRQYYVKLKAKNSKLKTTTKSLKLKNFYHIDLYRLEENLESEIKNLGLEEIWGRKENIIAIEWAEKIKDLLPENALWINFEYLDENQRKITMPDELRSKS